jgi:pimeloyl-ACP methyl ester carboxylesterase
MSAWPGSPIASGALVVADGADGIVPPDHSRVIAERIANARLVTLDGCGQMAPAERPDVVGDLLRDWLGLSR